MACAKPVSRSDAKSVIWTLMTRKRMSLLGPISTFAVMQKNIGRRPASDFQSLLDAWRNGGGNTIRSEFEKAYAAAHS